MDIIIPYKKSSLNGLELRYTLRGIEQYVSERGNVFLIGDCPNYCQNVIHIPNQIRPERQWKQSNICRHLLKAASDKQVSDDFLFMADDHFLLRELVPNYNYTDTLAGSLGRTSTHTFYRNTLLNTAQLVGEFATDYGHGPMVFNKELFIRAMALADWTKPWGYAIKSLYCHFNKMPGHFEPDLKIKAQVSAHNIMRLIKGRPMFSTGDKAISDDLLLVLKQLYPTKSQYEND